MVFYCCFGSDLSLFGILYNCAVNSVALCILVIVVFASYIGVLFDVWLVDIGLF